MSNLLGGSRYARFMDRFRSRGYRVTDRDWTGASSARLHTVAQKSNQRTVITIESTPCSGEWSIPASYSDFDVRNSTQA
jgi:hypothetical protein